MQRVRYYPVVIFICISLLALLGIAPLFLPQPAPASIPADRFSAERAMAHVQVFAESPRLSSSPGMDQAVSYLEEALRRCNLNPEIQKIPSSSGILQNTFVRIPGSATRNSILIVTHLDSLSYGAGDNATGAAVLLEVACSLQAGQPLKNDILLLFEDGEEAGYLGGYAFSNTGVLMFTVRRVIGLDTAAWGPVVLLQTTPGNADFIHAYAKSIARPTAFGFFADAGWNITQDTSEIQPFYEKGIPGLELEDPTAFTGKHSDDDSVENLRPGSMQQMGDQVLALARSLGDADLDHNNNSDESYFALWGIGTVHYPANWNRILVVLSAVGLIALTIKWIKQKACSLRTVTLSTILLSLVVVSCVLLGQAASMLFSRLFPNPNPYTDSYLITASLPFFLVVSIAVLLMDLFLRNILVKRMGESAAALAGMYVWLLVSILMVVLLKIGSYIFIIPFTTSVIALLLPGKNVFVRFIPAALATILFSPVIALLFIAAGLEALVLVALLIVLNAELWANALLFRSTPSVKDGEFYEKRTLYSTGDL